MEITVRKAQSELDGAKATETQHLTKIRALERELEDAKNMTSDVQRSERLTRVDLQEASKKVRERGEEREWKERQWERRRERKKKERKRQREREGE